MNRPLPRCLLASLALHGFLLGALAVGARFIPLKRPSERPVIVLNLPPASAVPRGATSGRETVRPTKAAPPLQKQASTPKRRIQLPAQALVPVQHPQAVAGLSRNADIPNTLQSLANPSPDSFSREGKLTANKVGTFAAPQPSLTLGTNLPQGESQTEGKIAVTPAWYASKVRAAYVTVWQPPEELADLTAGAEVEIVVDRNGNVSFSEIVAGSRNALLDRSVRKALDQVRFIEQFPTEWEQPSMTFRVRFDLTVREQLLAG